MAPPERSGQAVVLGGGIAGLAAARLLARRFTRVVVLERDERTDAPSPEDAFTTWQRGGVPQFRHSHAFLARLRQVLLAHLPDVLERLRAAGVREIPLAELVPPGMRLPPREDDEDVVLLACRRAAFEWSLRESARACPGVALHEGEIAIGLTGTSADGARPVVTGVRLADGGVLPASLVVDATGRRSRAPEWLAALGAPPPRERSAEIGIHYYTRFYRLRRGRAPQGTTGLVAGDLGWVKLAVFPGDNQTFSITVGLPAGESRLKDLSDPRRFERFLAAFPGIAPWRARGVSVPIAGRTTPVLAMGQLRNRLRRFVDREGPLAPGFVAIGDAAYHSNPIYGRGATSAVVQAALLDEALARHPNDVRAASGWLDRRSEVELGPFWEAAVSADRRALGEPPNGDLRDPLAWLTGVAEQAFGWFVDRGMLPASRVDPAVFRSLMRVFNMLEPPERLFLDPDVVLRSLPVLARVLRGDEPPPLFPVVRRSEVLARLG
ncbi:MAG TPA: NAD(P)-binding protein [Candidatus Binatia bacterium]|nr:NAD(P)-binding protein [Candidatus Binatia bacterium]